MFTRTMFMAVPVAALFSILSGSASAADNPPDGWRVLAPDGAGFSILMPGEPKATTEQQQSNAGPMLCHTYVYEAADASEFYVAGYDEYTVNLDVEQSLAQVRTSVIGKGKVLWERREVLDGHPGMKIAVTDGKSIWMAEFYIAGMRFYEAKYTTTNLLHAAVGAAPFLGSFHLSQ
jgi:hypothetical protein